jgi:hypothetical protein
MTKTKAAAIHLALSLVVATTTFLAIFFLWFPGALFEAAGGRKLFFLIAGVDVVLGPLLTLIIFAPGKKGLKFDLTVIALLQVSALAYGVHVLSVARPAFIVFAVDRFVLTRANEVVPGSLERARANGFGELPLDGPRLVGSRRPQDPTELSELMGATFQGADVHNFPHLYVPYEQARQAVLQAAQPIARLRPFNKHQPAAVDQALRKAGRNEQELRFLPMRAGRQDLTVFVDAADGRVVDIVDLKPWPFE